MTPQAAWFFMSVRAVTITLTVFVGCVALVIVAGRVADWSRPERKKDRATARREAQEAAAQRKRERQERWEALRGDAIARARWRRGDSLDEEAPTSSAGKAEEQPEDRGDAS